MKKIISIMLSAALLLAMTACGRSPYQREELAAIGIDPAQGKASLVIDSRTGLDHEGLLNMIITFPKNMEKQIQEDGRWRTFSSEDELIQLIFEKSENIRKFLPADRHGYYILLDGESNNLGDEFSIENGKFIFAMYDVWKHNIYYFQANI